MFETEFQGVSAETKERSVVLRQLSLITEDHFSENEKKNVLLEISSLFMSVFMFKSYVLLSVML